MSFAPENFQLHSTTVQRRLWVVHIHTREGNFRTGSGRAGRGVWQQILPPSCTRKTTTVATRLRSPSCGRAVSTTTLVCISCQRRSKYPFVSSLIKGKRSYILSAPCLTVLHGRKPQVCITQTQGRLHRPAIPCTRNTQWGFRRQLNRGSQRGKQLSSTRPLEPPPGRELSPIPLSPDTLSSYPIRLTHLPKSFSE
jgi:hypothetical protein